MYLQTNTHTHMDFHGVRTDGMAQQSIGTMAPQEYWDHCDSIDAKGFKVDRLLP